jgi:F0F1-type ATP synthase beta subunit
MAIANSKGTIINIRDTVVEVEFLDDPKPNIHEIVKLKDNEEITFEVIRSSGANTFFFINLSGKSNFVRGSEWFVQERKLVFRLEKTCWVE